MNDPPNVDVIVITHNSNHQLPNLIASLWPTGAVQASKRHLIVVDSGSSAGDQPSPQGRWRQINIKNYGYGTAANFGMKLSEADWVAIVNPDVRVTYEALQRVAIGASLADASIAAPKLQTAHGQSIPHWSSVPTPPWKKRTVIRQTLATTANCVQVAAVVGAALVVKRQAVMAIGGFDEGFFLYAEEIDLANRTRSVGGKVVAVESETALHLAEDSSMNIRPVWRTAQRIRGKARFHHKWNGKPAAIMSLALDLSRVTKGTNIRYALRVARAASRNPRRGLPWPAACELALVTE